MQLVVVAGGGDSGGEGGLALDWFGLAGFWLCESEGLVWVQQRPQKRQCQKQQQTLT